MSTFVGLEITHGIALIFLNFACIYCEKSSIGFLGYKSKKNEVICSRLQKFLFNLNI